MEADLTNKGKANGLCNRGACLSPVGIIFKHTLSGYFYCFKCADMINEVRHHKIEFPDGLVQFDKEASDNMPTTFDFGAVEERVVATDGLTVKNWKAYTASERMSEIQSSSRVKRPQVGMIGEVDKDRHLSMTAMLSSMGRKELESVIFPIHFQAKPDPKDRVELRQEELNKIMEGILNSPKMKNYSMGVSVDRETRQKLTNSSFSAGYNITGRMSSHMIIDEIARDQTCYGMGVDYADGNDIGISGRYRNGIHDSIIYDECVNEAYDPLKRFTKHGDVMRDTVTGELIPWRKLSKYDKKAWEEAEEEKRKFMTKNKKKY